MGGILEPPTTPIGRDELALKRHRFFSDLLEAAQAAMDNRVRFDPLGPIVNEVTPIEEEATPHSVEKTHKCEIHSNFMKIYFSIFILHNLIGNFFPPPLLFPINVRTN
jgi:hypothetical protein